MRVSHKNARLWAFACYLFILLSEIYVLILLYFNSYKDLTVFNTIGQ